jgi:hypothetical protein
MHSLPQTTKILTMIILTNLIGGGASGAQIPESELGPQMVACTLVSGEYHYYRTCLQKAAESEHLTVEKIHACAEVTQQAGSARGACLVKAQREDVTVDMIMGCENAFRPRNCVQRL